MDLRQSLTLFRKWAWLLALVAVIGGAAGYFYSRTIRPIYRAQTTVMVGRQRTNLDTTSFDSVDSDNLAQMYALLATQPTILQATAEKLNTSEPWQNLYFKVTATTVGTQILRIAAVDTDPQTAKTIADEVAQQLIVQGPIAEQQKQSQEQRTFVNSELANLKLQIESARKTQSTLNNQAALENDPTRLSEINNRISAIQTKIGDWQKNYASLSALLSNASNFYLAILAPAQVPTTPVSPNITQNIIFAALAGAGLAVGAILVLEYLDDTVKDDADFQRVLDLPGLGAISRIAGIQNPEDHLITLRHPRAPISEAYRILRTNLHFSGIENTAGALLVTSAGPGEGKTTTACNLGVVLAQAGGQVILLDADLRRPSVHRFFGLTNNLGFSNLFLRDAPALDDVIQTTGVPGLSVITSGPLPPNPTELLDSRRMTEILKNLRARSDLVILDSPPALAVADASILGSRCSGGILVVDAGHTRTEALRRAFVTLKRTGTKVYGGVLNKLSTRRASDYYHYYYYSSSSGAKSRRNGHHAEEGVTSPNVQGK